MDVPLPEALDVQPHALSVLGNRDAADDRRCLIDLRAAVRSLVDVGKGLQTVRLWPGRAFALDRPGERQLEAVRPGAPFLALERGVAPPNRPAHLKPSWARASPSRGWSRLRTASHP